MASEPPPFSARRLRENQDVMESLNRRMKERLEEIREERDDDPDAPFEFFCECADLDCRARLLMEPPRYEEIHRDPEQFVLLPGHEIHRIERVVDQEAGYLIVRKIV